MWRTILRAAGKRLQNDTAESWYRMITQNNTLLAEDIYLRYNRVHMTQGG